MHDTLDEAAPSEGACHVTRNARSSIAKGAGALMRIAIIDRA